MLKAKKKLKIKNILLMIFANSGLVNWRGMGGWLVPRPLGGHSGTRTRNKKQETRTISTAKIGQKWLSFGGPKKGNFWPNFKNQPSNV